ncbi:hypothetical protein INR49_023239 [Caranx melampygus]|nr:hypothetical protein INR49_023239 [Caranx melampygus]
MTPVTMSRGRGELLGPPADLTASPPLPLTARGKPNRLSRSLRLTPRSPRPDLRSPTRTHRPRAAGFSGESPHNDSDCQQDIVWDATSPPPCRLGKRGRKHLAPPNISEIVSRIAPKHGRPHVSEPALLQWIGDSATIPCTPDLQAYRPRRKSPRASAVDDLLKLARQFDLNMFHQEEEQEAQEAQEAQEEEDQHQQLSVELQNSGVAVNAAAGTDVQDPLDQHTEDDLDFLFDGPTQHISGDLSQVAFWENSTTTTNNNNNNDEFEDDWENDDLLNDSLVLEMTQNPLKFLAPTHCSTQRPAPGTKRPTWAGADHQLLRKRSARERRSDWTQTRGGPDQHLDHDR